MSRHRLLLALGLILLAPTVGELLLGNVPLSQAASILLLAPLYGGGALLIRETARRHRLGWAAIVPWAAAYALIEEGPVDQLVFNPGYLGLDSFAGFGEIPGLGISWSLTLVSLALHTVWSICAPIAVVEAFDPTPEEPWLGRLGYAATVVVFLLACVLLGWAQAVELDFWGTPAQFAVSAVVILGLVGLGVWAGRRPSPPRDPRPAPAPGRVAVAAFALTSGYWLLADLSLPGVLGVLAPTLVWLAAVVSGVVVVRRWSRRAGWDDRHRLALAAGALATYGSWFGLVQAAEAGTGPVEAVVGAVVVGAVVLVVVVLAVRRAVTRPPPPTLTGRSAPLRGVAD